VIVMTDSGELTPATGHGDTAPTAEVADALAEVEEQMVELAAHVRSAIREAATHIDPALQPFGLKILRMLRRCGPTHASVLAESLDVDRSVISRQARLLEELGLLELAADPADGRAKFLAPTPLAVEKMSAVPGSDKSFVNGRLAGWSETDLHEFTRLLKKLNSPDAGPANPAP
jgi:DNA-binding MarR family transcriptional regulator